MRHSSQGSLDLTDLTSIIRELEQQREAIDQALAALRAVAGAAPAKRRGRPPGSKIATSTTTAKWRGRPPKSTSSAVGVKRGPGRPPKKRSHISEEGRRRIAEAQKRRWATKKRAMRKVEKD